jgi:hypothetical protein
MLIWLGAHAILVLEICTGKSGFFSLQREPVLYWLDIVFSGACWLLIDFICVRSLIDAKRKKTA